MSIPFDFPVSVDDFTAYQEQLLGGPLDDGDQKVLSAWVPIFNHAYKEGRHNDIGGLRDSMSRMDQLIEMHSSHPVMTKFLKAARCWIIYAWRQGSSHA